MVTKKHEAQISFLEEFDWKQSHGGKRTGAERKASAVKTQVMRGPEPLMANF